jgi:high-affinity nickel-transport protein
MNAIARLSALRARVAGIYVVLVAANVAAWMWALLLFHGQPVRLGTALLVYGLGLRHAVDADHLAAIDNVIRKLMQVGERPVGAGFFFALGHSTVVVLAVAAAVTASSLIDVPDSVKSTAGLVGTLVSAAFLFVVAAANIIILSGIWRVFRRVRRGDMSADEHVDAQLLENRGFISRIVRPLFRLVTQSWHMFPLGLLFGIGFETASEVALLGISAGQATNDGSLWSVMVFPALFTAGMALVDTTDGILMLGAYDWAFKAPIRKLYYNLTITFVAVLVAMLIGSIEVVGLIGDKFALEGGFWRFGSVLNDNFNALGFAIIGIFIVAWAVSMIVYRHGRRDDAPEQRERDSAGLLGDTDLAIDRRVLP